MKIFAVIFCCAISLFSQELRVEPANINVGQEARFLVQGGADLSGPFAWFINGGNAGNSNSPDFRYVFKDPGNYTVRCQYRGDALEASFQVRDNRSLDLRPPRAIPGQEIQISGRNFGGPQVRLDLGDGRVETVALPYRTSYSNPGNYQVRAFDFNGESQTPVTASLQVEQDNRGVELLTNPAKARQKVSFRAVNFSQNNLVWDFGDGATTQGGKEAWHFYDNQGNYEVSVKEQGADSGTSRNFNIQPDDRQLTLQSPEPFISGYSLKFKAENFASSGLKWDFGDGAVQSGPGSMEHSFRAGGNYHVKVYEAEKPEFAVAKSIQVRQDNRGLKVDPETVFAGSEVTLTALYFFSPHIQWYFGDGSPIKGPASVKHAYGAPGTYQGRATDLDGQDSKKFEFRVVVKADNRQLKVPETVIAGELFRLEVLNGGTAGLSWQIEAEKVAGGSVLSRSFATPGKKTIVITDPGGTFPPLQKEITVLPDTRALKSSRVEAPAGEELLFQALNFLSGQILWDFGDGTKLTAGSSVKHAYKSPGTFQVKAVDLNGQSAKVFSQKVAILAADSEIQIDSLELTFGNGKYFRIFSLNSSPDFFRIRIKSRGRGLLKGRILLDGKTVLTLFQVELNPGQIASWKSSGKTQLPTNIAGVRTVSVEFTNFAGSADLPFLRYFVSTGANLEILTPESEKSYAGGETLAISWKELAGKLKYQIAVSEIPFPFLKEEQIEWRDADPGKESFSYTPEKREKERWLYIQLRALKAGRVEALSEITAIKIR
jgi:PKD repeat protein